MRTPRPLFPGARVALLSASSAVPEGRLAPALEQIRALGLEPIPYPTCHRANRHGYFSADDAARAADVTHAFCDPAIDGILAVRGGYGAHRILPLLDWAQIAAHPKLFAGYSDVTALHVALNQCCDLLCYHTIMPATEYYRSIDRASMDYLKRALFGGLTGALPFPQGRRGQTKALVGGQATGPLCGGNLSLLAASLGTPWEVDTRGKILFLEDVGEKFYCLDRMLTQLRNAGKFAACAGILLGDWTDCAPEDPGDALTLHEMLDELIVPAGVPTLAGLPCGHALPAMALPLGAMAALDADRKTLEVLA